MSFVPRKVARKNQPKSTSTSQSRTSTCSNPSTSTSLSLSSLENGKGKSKAIDDDEPSLPAKNQATSNSDVEPKPEYSSQNHLTANALYHLLSPVYLVHPNNIQLKDLLMNLGTQNGTKGIQEGGETYLHLSRLLTNPIISCLCSSLDSLTSALRELQDLEFIKLSASGFGLKLTENAKNWISSYLDEASIDEKTSLTWIEPRTIYLENLPSSFTTSLSISQHLKSQTSLSILSAIPSISPFNPLQNIGQGISTFSDPRCLSSDSRSNSFPSFISSSNLVALNSNSSSGQQQFGSSRKDQEIMIPDEIDWSRAQSNLSTNSKSLKSKRLFEEIEARRPRGGRALITLGPPSDDLGSRNYDQEFKGTLKKLAGRDFSTYRALAAEYVDYKKSLHDLGWKMNYPSSSTSKSYSSTSDLSSASTSITKIKSPVALQRRVFSYDHLLIIPSDLELQERAFPMGNIVKVSVEIKSNEESGKKKSIPKTLIQVEADRLIQKEFKLVLVSRRKDSGTTKEEREKVAGVDYVDWETEVAHLRVSTSYHAALLLRALSSEPTSTKVVFSDASILEGEDQEKYWNSLPNSVRNTSKKREAKVWSSLRLVLSPSTMKRGSEDQEGSPVLVDSEPIEKKKKKKSKKRKGDSKEEEEDREKKHVRFE